LRSIIREIQNGIGTMCRQLHGANTAVHFHLSLFITQRRKSQGLFLNLQLQRLGNTNGLNLVDVVDPAVVETDFIAPFSA